MEDPPKPAEPSRSAAAEVVITGDGSQTLYSHAYSQSYRSSKGALAEARAVFLEGSGVATRLAAGKDCAILEIGFGTGLNFLVTAVAAQAVAEQAATETTAADIAETGAPRGAGATGPRLSYLGLEREPPPTALLARLDYTGLLSPSPLPAELLDWLKSLELRGATTGRHVFVPSSAPSVTLELGLGEATSHDLGAAAEGGFDAVYLDAFSPKANPEAWQPPFLGRLARSLVPGGKLASFSVSGGVRRALAAHGLVVGKVAGPPGGKAEVLVARRPEP